MTGRDDLAALIKDAYYAARDSGEDPDLAADDAAGAIIAAGWRPPAELVEPTGPKVGGQRLGGRGTAVAAAELVKPKIGSQRRFVLVAIIDGSRARGGLTDPEIEEFTGFPMNSVRPRRVELVDAGWVRDSGERRKHRGRDHVVWTLTPAARERLGVDRSAVRSGPRG